MHSIAAIGEPHYFVEAKLGANAGDLGPGAADIDGQDLLGKNLTVAIGAEDANRDFDLLAGVAAPAHRFEQPHWC